MLILKSTHAAILAAKQAEVQALQDEVAWLRNFVQPVNKNRSFLISTEANAVLDGQQDQIDVSLTPEELERQHTVRRELDKILSGNY